MTRKFIDLSVSLEEGIKSDPDFMLPKINYHHSGQARLTACFSGYRQEINDRALLSLSLKMPFMTLKVMGGILFEAIKLKLKGLKVYPHPDHHSYQSTKALTIAKKKKKILQWAKCQTWNARSYDWKSTLESI